MKRLPKKEPIIGCIKEKHLKNGESDLKRKIIYENQILKQKSP